MKKYLGIDIGSTWTKGAIFTPDAEKGLRLEALFRTPTTVDDLRRGFDTCRGQLDPEGEAELYYSSSAKGGLRIAALGVVPELTLRMAREAACSAGGKITSVTAYKLCADDVAELLKKEPDIVLLTGGTDGGNEECVRHNLELLAQLPPELPVIYAGNRSLRDAVRAKLASRELKVVENVLPELSRPNAGPAREAIRELFLERIVSGRGLDRIVAETGREPVPTPLAMLEFLKSFYEYTGERTGFAVVDMGGATTDFYSACADKFEPNVMVRGIPEPPVKRTVEGDVGMRVSARAAFEEIRDELARRRGDDFAEKMEKYIDRVSSECEYLPQTPEERDFDLALAAGCCTVALRRHAGRRRQVFTTTGPVAIQTGRNLKSVSVVIGSGGFLSRMTPEELKNMWWDTPVDPECELLTPTEFVWYPDVEGLMVLVADAARGVPEAACRFLSGRLDLI
jgi:uncharacterized protein (TIGR01319 family)